MSDNLLKNGSFEADWDDGKSHRCHVFPAGGYAHFTNIGNVFVPPGWTFWYLHDPGTWDQPEGRDAHKSSDPARVHSGEKAFMYFASFRKHYAGLYQQVAVTPGTRLRLTAWAHAWSNHNLEGYDLCNNDPRCSCGVGKEAAFILEGDAPELNGDPWNDAISNFTFSLGIDPTGGTDLDADTVVWGTGAHIYNEYAPVPTVEATSQADVVTIFLRSRTLWAFRNNDAYWDDVVLEGVGGIGRGWPREQYERTYVLLPPDATREEAHALLDEHWDARHTIGFSADDAGVGDLDVRRVKALRPEAWPGDLGEFFKKHYPGVELEELHPLVVMGQCDAPWGTQRYAGGAGPTFCAKGCWIVDCAQAQRYYGINPGATPLTVDAAVGPSGYNSDFAMTWAAMSRLGLKVLGKTTSNDKARAHLDKGKVCFAEVSPTSYLHFVMVTKYEGHRFWMLDPYKRVEGWIDDYYAGVDGWRLIDRDVAVEEPPPRTTQGHIGLHLQTMAVGWDAYVGELRPPVAKVLASMHDVLGVKRACPDTAVVFRHVHNAYGDTLECPDPMRGARNWVDKFRSGLCEMCNQIAQEFPSLKAPYAYVESVNECMPSLNEAHVKRNVNFDIAFCDALAETGLPVAPAVFCAAVGNPHESEYDLLVPLARKCEQAGGMMGYHGYWYANQRESGLESWWKYHAGRWQEMDKVFVANGVYVRWYGGESGAVGSSDGHHLLANAGWKAPECYGGDWARYLADILECDRLTREWNRTHGDRYLGAVLFTTGAEYTGWAEFQIQEPQMRAIRAALAERYG